jgi:TolB protein
MKERLDNPGRRFLAISAGALAAALIAVAPAQATFPGKNGKIAFSFLPGTSNSGSANFEITTIIPGQAPVALPAQNPFKDNWPDWSPDGEKIVWWHQVGGNIDVWVMNRDGSGQVNLTTENPGADVNAAWSPDGTEIVLDSNYQTESGFSELQVMDASGTFFRQMTNNGAEFDNLGQFSPDGKRIAWAHDPTGEDAAIYTMDADDGGNVVQVTPDWLKASVPDWSPDGEWIAFADNFCGSCGNSDIWMIRKDGTDLTRLTNTPFDNEFRPGFSPDGRKITFTSVQFPFNVGDIYVMNLRSRGMENITNTPNFQERAADWGPRVQGEDGD